MTQQRVHRRSSPRASAPDTERPEDTAARLGLSPAELSRELAAADGASRVRTLDDLQAGVGNAAIDGLLGASGRVAGFGIGQGGVTTRTTDVTVSREAGEPELLGSTDEVVPLDAGAQTNVMESVGPVTESSYAIEASTLADVAAAIGGRSEAGHVGWGPALDFHQTDGRIDSVTISVSIDLQMPSWSPPSTMLPKARAEWDRWYSALRAHEQGHIDLVHKVFDGLAARLLGKTVAVGQQLFENAKVSLNAQSRAFDTRTGNGTKSGTIMNLSIEQQEIDEERKKREDAEKAKKRESAVPKVGDEEE
jgi:predicted secreted Zn-dependent protease